MQTVQEKFEQARAAHGSLDSEMSKLVHDRTTSPAVIKSKEAHLEETGLRDIIYGALDGIIEQFAVVSSVAGAGLDPLLAVVLGVATLIADAFSMGIGDYLADQAETHFAKSERERERWEVENFLEGEKQEMVELYMKKGLTEADAKRVVEIISKDKEVFVDFMMVEELGILPEDEDDHSMRNALLMFASFILFGAVPLICYAVTNKYANFNAAFIVTIVLTMLELFTLGAIKGKLSGRNIFYDGLQMSFNGAVACAVAYAIGYGFGQIAL